MDLLVFDIGGSTVKYAVWHNDSLLEQSSFNLPSNWESMKKELYQIYQEKNSRYNLSGVSFSAPGVVDSQKGEIRGISAVPYIHNFKIEKELSELFNLPIAMENDANCAALAEVWQGEGRDVNNSVFFVVGSGIGGAVVINRKLLKGRNLFAGEFGYMPLNDSSSLSEMGSSVRVVAKYNSIKGTSIDGKELFELANQKDALAEQLTDKFYKSLARGIFNLLVCFDPDKVIIGGGISKNPVLIPNIEKELEKILVENGMVDYNYQIVPCKFGNDANLIGAVYQYKTIFGFN